MKSSGQLEKILNAQISPLIKVGIGYKGETSKSKVQGSKDITFVKVVIKENRGYSEKGNKGEKSGV